MNLALTLDSEFKRVAGAEKISMESLMDEAAQLTGRTPREIYNYRSGKWPLPSNLIPVLVKRFNSYLLLDALREECRDVRHEVPDLFDLSQRVAATVGDDMKHYNFLLEAFQSGGVDEQEMVLIEKSGSRIIENVYQLLAVAREDCIRRATRRETAGKRAIQ
jgi:hypothetical protein